MKPNQNEEIKKLKDCPLCNWNIKQTDHFAKNNEKLKKLIKDYEKKIVEQEIKLDKIKELIKE